MKAAIILVSLLPWFGELIALWVSGRVGFDSNLYAQFCLDVSPIFLFIVIISAYTEGIRRGRMECYKPHKE